MPQCRRHALPPVRRFLCAATDQGAVRRESKARHTTPAQQGPEQQQAKAHTQRHRGTAVRQHERTGRHMVAAFDCNPARNNACKHHSLGERRHSPAWLTAAGKPRAHSRAALVHTGWQAGAMQAVAMHTHAPSTTTAVLWHTTHATRQARHAAQQPATRGATHDRARQQQPARCSLAGRRHPQHTPSIFGRPNQLDRQR